MWLLHLSRAKCSIPCSDICAQKPRVSWFESGQLAMCRGELSAVISQLIISVCEVNGSGREELKETTSLFPPLTCNLRIVVETEIEKIKHQETIRKNIPDEFLWTKHSLPKVTSQSVGPIFFKCYTSILPENRNNYCF